MAKAAPAINGSRKPSVVKSLSKGKTKSKKATRKAAAKKAVQGIGVLGALSKMHHDQDTIREAFESGDYPYKKKIKRAVYETHKRELQVELLKVQDWVEKTGERVVILFEGRDAAGKGWHHQALHGASQSARRAGGGAE